MMLQISNFDWFLFEFRFGFASISSLRCDSFSFHRISTVFVFIIMFSIATENSWHRNEFEFPLVSKATESTAEHYSFTARGRLSAAFTSSYFLSSSFFPWNGFLSFFIIFFFHDKNIADDTVILWRYKASDKICFTFSNAHFDAFFPFSRFYFYSSWVCSSSKKKWIFRQFFSSRFASWST